MCWGQFPASAGAKSTPTWVAAGTFSTVVVTTDHGCVNGFTNGEWDCWGSNASGQLGTSPSTLASSAPFFTVHAMDNAPAIVFPWLGDPTLPEDARATPSFVVMKSPIVQLS